MPIKLGLGYDTACTGMTVGSAGKSVLYLVHKNLDMSVAMEPRR